MRVLILVPSLMRAGAETQAVDLANGLATRGYTVTLCSFERQLDQRDRLVGSVRFRELRRSSKYDAALVRDVARIIDSQSIDVVFGILQIAVLVAWAAAGLSRRGPPVCAAIHTTVNRDRKQEFQEKFLYRHVLRRVAAVVFVCNAQKSYWVDKYPELTSLSHVAHNGIDADRFSRSAFSDEARRFRSQLDIPEAAFVFTSIAAFRPEKGHQLLVSAFSEIDSESHLVLVGDGPLRSAVERQIQSLGISERVHLLGIIDDIRPIVVASDATVLASTAVETFSMAMLESMALGTPMLAPRIGGLPEAIEDGVTGLLFDIGDVSALSALMRRAVADRAGMERMGLAACDRVRSRFSLASMVQRYEDVIRCLRDRI